MTTSVNLRKILHRKAWEMATPTIAATTNGGFITGDKDGIMPQNDCVYMVNGASSIYNYNLDQDAWLQLPNSGITGAYAAGSCGEFRTIGMLGGSLENTATAGTTTTLTTNRTVTRDIYGSKIRVVSGTGVGYEGTVSSVRVGANSVITVTPANGVAFDATTTFRIWSGSLWFFNAGTTAVGFSVWDRATNTWTAKSVTNLPTSFGTGGQLIATGSYEGVLETGTSTGSNTTSTLIQTTKNWQTNQWANAQVRITAGTGVGQIRAIVSGTSNTLTISGTWTVTPDATSVYAIEGCDDYMYLVGNNAVTLYRYVVSTNTWSTLTPSVARAGALGAGGTADWIHSPPEWVSLVDANSLSSVTGIALFKQPGRYVYSFRGAGSNTLDVYDISLNTWMSAIAYGNQNETFNTGSSSCDSDGNIYIIKEATGRVFKFNIDRHIIEPFTTNVYPQSTAVTMDSVFIRNYIDGGTKVPFLYLLRHSGTEFIRMMIF